MANGIQLTALLWLTVALVPGTAIALEDPMRPPVARSAPPEGRTAVPQQHYRLNSILISAQRRIAVINGYRLSVGDRIGNARLIAIEPDRATLSESGRTFTLHLIPVTIKRPVLQPE